MMKRRWVPGILSLSIGANLLVGCSKPAPDPRSGAQLVRVTEAKAVQQSGRDYTGVITARVTGDLGFQIGGKVIQRLVTAGQAVRRGQPLMKIDRTDFVLATDAQVGSVDSARARAVQAAADERRYRDLVSAGAVSASSYDQIKATADSTRAQLAAAQAQERAARNQASYAVLLADADGTVVETMAEPGQVVTAGQTVVRLAHAGPREAAISLPETVRPAIGSTALASVFNRSGEDVARLRQLSDAADPQTRTFDARYVLSGAASVAPLGATVSIRIPDRGSVGSMTVPLGALYDKGQGPGVWIVAGRPLRVTWRPVQVTALGEESATLAGGLRAGEHFVALGAHYLHEGQPVRIAPDQVAAR